MLGSGIFVLPGVAVTLAGPHIWVAYLLAGLSILPAATSKAELATAMPTSGGTYVYVERTFGPIAGTIAGLGLWLSLLLKSGFALVGFGAYLSIFADIDIKNVALVILAMITVINILGVGKVSGILTASVIASIISLIALSGFTFFSTSRTYTHILDSGDTGGILAATALVFVAFSGVTKVAAIAEEIKEPERNLPKGILISLISVTMLYCLVTFILTRVVSLEELSGNLMPIYSMAQKSLNNWGSYAIAFIAIITTISMSNSGLLAASRFPFAMSRDHLLPSILGRVHPRFLTPVWSILISALVILFALVFMDVERMVKQASAFMIMIYMIENIAVMVLRELQVQWYRPTYKSPFYPYTQILGITATVGLLFSMGIVVIPYMLSIAIPGGILYLIYSRKKTDRLGVVGIRGRRQDLIAGAPATSSPSRMAKSKDFMDAKVIAILLGKEKSPEMLVEMGVHLAEKGGLEVAYITEVPEQTDLNDLIDEPAELQSLRRRIVAMTIETGESVTFDSIVSHDITRTISELSQRHHCKWLIIEWRGRSVGALTFHNPLGWLKGHLQCSLGIFRCMGVRYFRKIMVLLRDNDNDDVAIETATRMAIGNNADITLFKYLPDSTSEELHTVYLKVLEEKAKNFPVQTYSKIISGEAELQTIVQATVGYDLFVFGSLKFTFWGNLLGTMDDELIKESACSVIAVQRTKTALPE